MSRPVCARFCHGRGADKTYRSFSFNHPSCITGTIKRSKSSAATDKYSKIQWIIPRGPVLEQGVKERTTVVDSKFETLQRSLDNTTSVLCYNKNRCLQEGVVCILSRDPNRRGMEIRGKGNAHKYSGIEGSDSASMSFHKQMKMKAVHFQVDNTTALMYLLKMGGCGNKRLLDLAKDIWDYILKKEIMITAEYLPSCLNVEADWQAKNPRGSLEWKLLPQIFHQICQIKETPEIDLFASCLSY